MSNLKDFLHLTTQAALVAGEICFAEYQEDILRHLRAAQGAAVLADQIKRKALMNMTHGVAVKCDEADPR